MAGLGQFAAGFLQAFTAAKGRKQEKEEEETEKKARLKLFEVQMERAAREGKLAEQAALEREQFFNAAKEKLTAKRPLPGTGVMLGDVASPGSMAPTAPQSLSELLADPEMALKALQGGVVSPQSLMPQPQELPNEAAMALFYQQNPWALEQAKALRGAGASNVRVDLGAQGLSPPPSGYARTDPTKPGLIVEPGGPVDQENKDKAKKEASKVELIVKKSDSVIEEIGKAKALIGPMSVGFSGARLKGIEQTDAYALSKVLESIKANIGFDRLQEMRDASPTGGALGQVAVQELQGLQASITSIDQGLRGEELSAALDKVLFHYDNWKRAASGEEPEAPTGKVVDWSELPD